MKLKVLLHFVFYLFVCFFISCNDNVQKIKAPKEENHFALIIDKILTDSNYSLVEQKQYLLSSGDPVVKRIEECYPKSTIFFDSISQKTIIVSSATFRNKNLFLRNPTIYGTSIQLIEWKIKDSSDLREIKEAIDQSYLIRCGIKNTYEPLLVNGKFYFSWIYDYDNREKLKNPLMSVLKVYQQE